MLATCWLALGLFQARPDPVRRIEMAQAMMEAQSAAAEQAKNARIEEERRLFEEQLNRLAAALADFQREYHGAGGQVWPKKQADALKKAIQGVHLP